MEKTADTPAGVAVLDKEEQTTEANNSAVASGNAPAGPFADRARDYATLGLYVFPVRSRGKEPLTRSGFKDASTDVALIDTWAAAWPDANIGVDTARSGLLVVDCDSQDAIGEARTLGLPETATARTGNGAHYYFRLPDGAPAERAIHTGQSGKIDLLADGYTILPESIHPTGRVYEWVVSPFDIAGCLPDAPTWAVDALRDAVEKRGVKSHGTQPVAPDQRVNPPVSLSGTALERWNGTLLVTKADDPGALDRSEHLFALACDLHRAGADGEQVASAIAGWDSRLPDPKFTNRKDRDERYRETVEAAARCVEQQRQRGGLFADANTSPAAPRLDLQGPLARPATAGASRLPRMFTATALLSTDMPEAKWTVPGILPAGCTIVAGAPKIGESWMALDLAMAVASGGSAFGVVSVEAGDVLYLALEDSERRLKDRIQQRLVGRHMNLDRLTLTTQSPALDQGGLDAINGWMTEHPDARLIIVDTLARVRPARMRNGNQYEEDYKAIIPLHRLANDHNIAVVIIHHVRKMGSDDPLDEVSGTNGLNGAADNTMVLKRAGQGAATLYMRGRDVDDQELALERDPDHGFWRLAGSAEEYRLGEAQRVVLDAVRGGVRSIRAIAQATGKKEDAVRQLLGKLKQRGLVWSSGGEYTTPPEALDLSIPHHTTHNNHSAHTAHSHYIVSGAVSGEDSVPAAKDTVPSGAGDLVALGGAIVTGVMGVMGG